MSNTEIALGLLDSLHRQLFLLQKMSVVELGSYVGSNELRYKFLVQIEKPETEFCCNALSTTLLVP